MHRQPARFRDPTSSYSLPNLARNPIHVACPRCTAHAHVTVISADDGPPTVFPRRLLCPACGHTRDWPPSRDRSSRWGAPFDPFFLQPLWLSTTVRGHRLWAYNREHLTLLTDFVAADLRERGPYGGCSMSMLETLPAWMKSSRNRPDVLAAASRLQSRLSDPGRPVISRRPHPPAAAPALRRYSLHQAR